MGSRRKGAESRIFLEDEPGVLIGEGVQDEATRE
jgi:hypothetical protein